jgi:TLD
MSKHGSRYDLLYRGSRDGWNGADFHAKCDGKGKTITFMLTDKDIICGGYTSVPWQAEGGDKEDQTAFIFSVKTMKVYPNTMKVGVLHAGSTGPRFDSTDGVDLGCYSQPFNGDKKCRSRCNQSSYKIPQVNGLNEITMESGIDFTVREVEVYLVS